jgi:hypothetical protein
MVRNQKISGGCCYRKNREKWVAGSLPAAPIVRMTIINGSCYQIVPHIGFPANCLLRIGFTKYLSCIANQVLAFVANCLLSIAN